MSDITDPYEVSLLVYAGCGKDGKRRQKNSDHYDILSLPYVPHNRKSVSFFVPPGFRVAAKTVIPCCKAFAAIARKKSAKINDFRPSFRINPYPFYV